MRIQISVERHLIFIRINRPVQHGKTGRLGINPVSQHLQRFFRRLILVAGVKTLQINAAFGIGKTLQIFIALWIIGALQPTRQAIRLVKVVINNVTHQAYKDQVYGITQSITHRHDFSVFIGRKIIKMMQAAAGEKIFAGTG